MYTERETIAYTEGFIVDARLDEEQFEYFTVPYNTISKRNPCP
jgi:hypothetical protein